ncbi:TetR/AcrR family transcriptional regulator [Hymenobacter sp.]|jgi:AcrR family transcriptional regulator|uniref:TetR/AcrR family transcriptional regulator n=1 Tax=Hymenobacter sp. TaxID=1898978 RepID=UPI002ED86E47
MNQLLSVPETSSVALPSPLHPRQRILAAALALFMHRGLLAVTMADLATYLGMSKKTLYKWFASKTALVCAMMNAYTDYFREELNKQSTYSHTAVEELLTLYAWLQEEQGHMHQQVFQELKLYFPEGWELWQDHCSTFLCNHIRNNLRWGILQGLYHPNLNVELLSRLWLLEMSIGQGAYPPQSTWELEPLEVQQTLLTHFMIGIMTPAGASLVRRLQEIPSEPTSALY